MSNLADLPVHPTPAAAGLGPNAEKLEQLALALARTERTFGELEQQLAREQNALAKTRKLLIAIMWPRHETTKGN